MNIVNHMAITFDAKGENEAFARSLVAAFCLSCKPTLDEITDIKTAVSEAVTNVVVHAYPNGKGNITIEVSITDTNRVIILIKDNGIGIENFEQARQPFFTTKPTEERSGMGFTIMESFMDKVLLTKNSTGGVCVAMEKNILGEKKLAAGE